GEGVAARVGEQGAQHQVLRARDVAALPLPVLAHVDQLVAFVEQLLDLIRWNLPESIVVAHSSSAPDQSPSPQAPTLSTFSDSSAHLTLAGEIEMPRSSKTSSLLILRASSRLLPLIRSVSSEADACEMAQPRPWKRTSSIWPSLTLSSMPTTSPQRGLSSSCESVGASSRP